jgi:hypothetical protein
VSDETPTPDEQEPLSGPPADEAAAGGDLGAAGATAGAGDDPGPEATAGQGTSIVVFETEEQARQAAPPVGAAPVPGATIASASARSRPRRSRRPFPWTVAVI